MAAERIVTIWVAGIVGQHCYPDVVAACILHLI